MARKRADQLKVGQTVMHEGQQHTITNKTQDGDVYEIILDGMIVLRRPAGAKLELA